MNTNVHYSLNKNTIACQKWLGKIEHKKAVPEHGKSSCFIPEEGANICRCSQ